MTEPESQSCPRRLNEMGPWSHTEGLDSWVTPRDRRSPSRRDPGPLCSFCGSLEPGRFLELVGEGWVVDPTLKTYKAYLTEVLHAEPATVRPGKPLPPVVCGRAKFYFPHLVEPQKLRFIELYNTHVMKVGFPGRFDPLPYFMEVTPHGAQPSKS